MQDSQKEHVKYRMMAYVEKLSLNKKINFQTKISWKRNVNKVQTDIVTHQNCESIFNQMLELELNLVYDTLEAKFQPKFTEFSITVIYQGKIKSGGYVKYDAAQIINQNYSDERVYLNILQCPDPQAYLQIVFSYEVISQSSRSLFNQLSMLNPSGFEQDLSQIDFQQEEQRKKEFQSQKSERSGSERAYSSTSIQKNQNYRLQNQKPQQNLSQPQQNSKKQTRSTSSVKQSEQIKINNIIDKFQNLARRIAQKKDIKPLENIYKNESNQIERQYKKKILGLQNQLQERQNLIKQYESKILSQSQYISQLQLQLQRLKVKNHQQLEFSNKKIQQISSSSKQYQRLYENIRLQFLELNNRNSIEISSLKKLLQLQKTNIKNQQDIISLYQQKKLQYLNQNLQLQGKIATVSHNIAQIFNAAYDYGGAKLLDYLQGSIGLIQT